MEISNSAMRAGVFLRTAIIEPLKVGIGPMAPMSAVQPKAWAALLRVRIRLDAAMGWRFENPAAVHGADRTQAWQAR